MLRLANGAREVGDFLSLLIVVFLHVVHVDQTKGTIHIELCGETGTSDLAAVRLAGQYLVTSEQGQTVILAKTLNLVVQRGGPTQTITVAFGELCLVVGVGRLTAIPVFGLAPVTA